MTMRAAQQQQNERIVRAYSGRAVSTLTQDCLEKRLENPDCTEAVHNGAKAHGSTRRG